MDVSKRLQYNIAGPDQDREECEKAFWLETTLDRHISGTLNFEIPPDPECFTDVNAAYISVTIQVFKADGRPLDRDDRVFVTPGSLQSLFQSCQVFLNGCPLDPSNAYSWSATLTSYFGVSKTARQDVWAELAGQSPPNYNSSKILPKDVIGFMPGVNKVAGSKQYTLTGRLMSDFMQSCAQPLPPGMKLEVKLRRSPDAFSLCSCTEDRAQEYKVVINTASLFVRRIRMCKPVLDRTLESLANGGGLAYTRMECIVNQIPAQGVSYRVGNLMGGGALPHTLYLVLANQMAFTGSKDYLGNYFETGFLKSIQVYENGRPVLTKPIQCRFVYGEEGQLEPGLSDATQPFLSMTQAMNGIADSHVTSGVNYYDFLRGTTVSCVQLNSCGGTRMAPGFLDVELVLEEDIDRHPMLLLAFGEFEKHLRFDQNRRLVPF